jgi:DNA-binding SARP family transcriptional activator/TolB-like protein
MSKLSSVTLRLLGAFAIEANVGRSVPILVRSKKARALLAYLAMQPDYRARREELATLFWGDNPDMQARHNLRQCLISLRQDLCIASEILIVDREAIGLRAQLVSVDARTFASLARSAGPDELTEAAKLWRGAFFPDLALDIEEFDAWRCQQSDRLAEAAAGVFDALGRSADADGDGDRALAAVERLVVLDPTREDRQRIALKLCARYRGRDAALSRARQLTDFLRGELDVSPEPATCALIDAIKRGDFERAPASDCDLAAVQRTVETVNVPAAAPLSLPVRKDEATSVPAPYVLAAIRAPGSSALTTLRFRHRRSLAVALTLVALLTIGSMAVLGIAYGPKSPLQPTGLQGGRRIVVLPFTTDGPAQTNDPSFAKVLTHNVIGYLSRFGNLRVISEPTSDFYGDHQTDVNLPTELGVQYAIVGQVQGNDSDLRIDFQLVDAATRTNVWSDTLERARGDQTLVADEAARGIARMLAIEVDRLAALQARAKPTSELTVGQLVARGYFVLQTGSTRESLSAAMKWFDEGLRRDPHYQPALLAVARLQIIAAMNFIDLDPSPDLKEAERLLNESLSRFPNSISALYSLALLQKYHRQYQASMRSLQRCLELNPSFLPAQGQIADILARTGEPQKGLQQILQTIGAATPHDPSIGYWYLFAAEAELELGQDQAALQWALRAETLMPSSPLVQAWLASIYTNIGDKSNAARYATALTKLAPDRTRLFMQRPIQDADNVNGRRRLRIFEGLRLALGASLG